MDATAFLPLRIARNYVRRGWSVVPIPYRRKKPLLASWDRLRLTEGELSGYFGGRPQNIGVLVGAPSMGLVDIDLDHALAVEMADDYLPPTRSIFGRASKRRSHRLYYSTAPVATKQWRLPNRQMIVELRSTGGQTVFPGSVHESGEPIEWETDGEPTVIDPNSLRDCLQVLSDEVRRRLGLVSHGPSRLRADTVGAPPAVLARARKYLAKLPPAVSGQGGHNATFHAACILVIGFGLDREQSLALLREWNTICQPPWSENELAHKIDDALRQPGWRGYLVSKMARAGTSPSAGAVARANRHAIEHRRRVRRRRLA